MDAHSGPQIRHDPCSCIEPHGSPVVARVLRPTAIAGGRESHPSGVHDVGMLLHWGFPQKQFGSMAQCVEDERIFNAVICTQGADELG